MSKYDFSKAALQVYLSHTSALVFSYKLIAYLQNSFFEEHLRETASVFYCISTLKIGLNDK